MILLPCAIVSHSVSTHSVIFFSGCCWSKANPHFLQWLHTPPWWKSKLCLAYLSPRPQSLPLPAFILQEHWIICSSLLHDTLQTSETFPGVCPQSELPPLNLPHRKLLYNFYISGQCLLLCEVFPDCAGRLFFPPLFPLHLKQASVKITAALNWTVSGVCLHTRM